MTFESSPKHAGKAFASTKPNVLYRVWNELEYLIILDVCKALEKYTSNSGIRSASRRAYNECEYIINNMNDFLFEFNLSKLHVYIIEKIVLY